MELDYLIFIGHFQPFHNGHLAIAQHALSKAKKLIILVGSAETPRNLRNPWTFAERRVMIESSLQEYQSRLVIRPLLDFFYNESQWLASIQRAINDILTEDNQPNASVGIIDIQTNSLTTHYGKQFPQWKHYPLSMDETLHSQELRHYVFDAGKIDFHGGLLMLRGNVPSSVFEMIDAFRKNSPIYSQLVNEFHFIQEYKSAWDNAPYPPVFVTTDAVVAYSGHILLIRRRSEPGKGLWALPGGFIKQNESLLESCIRELREETRLKVPAPVLTGSLKQQHVFDHPHRSSRGRTITHAFYFEFLSGELPAVRGADDADKARWVPISQVLEMRSQLFEDHWHILSFFIL